MIGGIVTDIVRLKDRFWVECVDANERRSDKCAIYVECNPNSEAIKRGDSIWWQGGYAMWTAKTPDGKVAGKPDVRIPKIGFSGISKPKPL